MDDLTITTTTHLQARWILRSLEGAAIWVRMTFKPQKSRALIIRRGKGTPIPSHSAGTITVNSGLGLPNPALDTLGGGMLTL